jgi:basic amino acid/polyamine antiporter, APA family
VYAAAPASPAKPADGLGLSAATALVVWSIVGVGIFNLPTSLTAFGPISLISMGLTTIGAIALAMLFAALSRRMPADGCPYAYGARHDLPSTSAAVSGGELG